MSMKPIIPKEHGGWAVLDVPMFVGAAIAIAVVAIVVGLAFYRMTRLYVVLAFVPMLLHALYGTYKLSHRVKFHRLGYLLLAQSVLFGLVLWRVWE